MVEQVIGRLKEVLELGPDSFDLVEVRLELEEEFGPEVVAKAISILEKRDGRAYRLSAGDGPDEPHGPTSMWDRDLDG